MQKTQSKTRVGFEGRNFTAKPSYKGYKMRIDSALKLLRASDEWTVKRTRDRNLGERSTRSTDSDHYRGEAEWTELDEETLERIEEKAREYNYNASIDPEEGVLEIWSNALGTWELRNEELKEVAQ